MATLRLGFQRPDVVDTAHSTTAMQTGAEGSVEYGARTFLHSDAMTSNYWVDEVDGECNTKEVGDDNRRRVRESGGMGSMKEDAEQSCVGGTCVNQSHQLPDLTLPGIDPHKMVTTPRNAVPRVMMMGRWRWLDNFPDDEDKVLQDGAWEISVAGLVDR